MMQFRKIGWICLGLATVLTLVGKLLCPIRALTPDGNAAVFFLMGLVTLIYSDSLPGGYIGILAITMLPVLGLVGSLQEAAGLFGNQLFFYLLACYAISIVMKKLPTGNRLLLLFVKRCKSTRGTIASIIISSAIISSFVSNFPAALIIMMISKQYLEMIADDGERERIKPPLMIGLVIAVGIGGSITPMGSAGMMMLKTFLAEGGYEISFLQWVCFALPHAVIWLAIALALIFKAFPIPEQPGETRERFIQSIQDTIPPVISREERLAMVILGITFFCWIVNFNMMVITCLCCLLLLFPPFGLISWKEFTRETNWGTTVLVCALVAVISVVQKHNVINWLMEVLASLVPAASSELALIAILGIFVPVTLILMPNGTAVVTVVGTAIVPLAESLGLNPIVIMMAFAFFTGIECVIPVGSRTLVMYEGGKNFKASDMAKITIPLALCTIVTVAIWVPLCATLLGLN